VVTGGNVGVCTPLSWLWCALHIVIAAIAIAALVVAVVTRVQWQQQGTAAWPTLAPDGSYTSSSYTSSSYTSSSSNSNVTSSQVIDQLNALREQYSDLLSKVL
jgi:hypothetical protein